MIALVTGATGFVGSAVTRHLVRTDADVRVLARPGSDRRALAGLPVDVFEGDVRRPETLDRAMGGVDVVFHLAALYSLSSGWRRFLETNVAGTRHVLAAARRAGVGRVVVTSAVGAVGSAGRLDVADEETIWDLGPMAMPYATSKLLAEMEALRAVARGQDVVVVNPTAAIGEWDWKPTPTGELVLRYLQGRLPAMPPLLANFVDVEDVARGHLLAAERGRSGERYILGGENLDARRLLAILEEVTGRKAPRLRLPVFVARTTALATETALGAFGLTTPYAAGSVAVLARRMHVTSAKAEAELGYRPGPVKEAFARAVRWYRSRNRAR